MNTIEFVRPAYKLLPQLFADLNTNVTTQTGAGQDMSPGMKTFYNTALLENHREDRYFNQFGVEESLPRGNGNKIEWRKWNTFAPALTPLTEGVNPDGKKFGQTKIEAECTQHGDYTSISDRLELEYVDPVIQGATEEMSAAMYQTLDLLTRNVLVGGSSVMYAPTWSGTTPTPVTSRTGINATAVLTPDLIARVVTALKKSGVPRINGKYVMIIHPSESYDLRKSEEWIEAHKYAAVTEIFDGEIGELHGMRFVETNNVKVVKGGATISGTDKYAVYLNLAFGAGAYGVIKPEGMGAEMIIHDKNSGGTSNPLNLYSTIGYKFKHGAKILYQERIIRVEAASSLYSATEEEN